MSLKAGCRLPFLVVLFFAIGSAAQAAPGAGELSLDRAAVQSLLQAAIPDPLKLAVPGAGDLTLRIGAPKRVEFNDGGVEVMLPFRLEELGYSSSVGVRYVPQVEREQGTVRLVAEHVVPEAPLPVPVNLAALLPPADLPRSVDGILPTLAGKKLEVTCFVQGVRVEDERLVIDFGLVVRRLHLDDG